MALDLEQIRQALGEIKLPNGGDLVTNDLVRALSLKQGRVQFVIEAASPEDASLLSGVRSQAEERIKTLPGVESVSVVLTAHGAPQKQPAPSAAPPNLKLGRHPTPSEGPAAVSGVDRILAIASGKGGVGKSTVSSNLAVALARAGRRVGLLDADIYGPSQPRMMGVNSRPSSPDGKAINPLHAHGVTMMSLGLMVPPEQAIVWRGPMLMGALQQMLTQVKWGKLDVLIVDLPPGTGDVQLTLCQKAKITGAIVVSTPQDVALIDARKAIDMFARLGAPILGLIENMSMFVCPKCGYEAEIFGHGGVRAEAEKLNLPFLAALPIDLETRLAGDEGVPIATGDGPMAASYAALAERLIEGGMG